MSEITATKEQQNKYEALKEYLRSLESVCCFQKKRGVHPA